MQFLLLLVVWPYKRQYTYKTLTLRKIYECASELRTFSHFHILKLHAISFNILLLLQIICLRKHIYFQVPKYFCMLYNECSSLYYLWYGAIKFKRQYTDTTSELRKLSHFYILSCYFLQYFVGVSDALSQEHIYFQVSK